MGIFGAALKAGLAKKAISEARKPQNQRRIKDAIASFRGKGNSTGTTRTGRR